MIRWKRGSRDHHLHQREDAELNLIPLIDILSVMVAFLLVYSVDVEVVPMSLPALEDCFRERPGTLADGLRRLLARMATDTAFRREVADFVAGRGAKAHWKINFACTLPGEPGGVAAPVPVQAVVLGAEHRARLAHRHEHLRRGVLRAGGEHGVEELAHVLRSIPPVHHGVQVAVPSLDREFH